MKVRGFQLEIFSMADGQNRKVAVYQVPRRRNSFYRIVQVLEQINKTFNGFVAMTVVPMIQDDEQKGAQDGQGIAETPAAGDVEAVRAELGSSVAPAGADLGTTADVRETTTSAPAASSLLPT